MTFAAAVVIYNMSCCDSPTCRALQNMNDQGVPVLIYDNSTRDFGNRAYCDKSGWVYLGGSGNVGISKAYNACIDYLLSAGNADMLCLFDDDTDLDVIYFSILRKACETTAGKIFVPLIYSNDRLLSPCILKPGHKVCMFKNEAEALSYDGNELTAINSCMAVDLSLFIDYRYDVSIFLDGVDHSFVMAMRDRGEFLSVIPYRCVHAFSGGEKPSLESALVRFRIYAKDYRYVLRNNKLAYLFLVGKRALRLCLQYKTLVFIKEAQQNINV